jgi:hypothetical protein
MRSNSRSIWGGRITSCASAGSAWVRCRHESRLRDHERCLPEVSRVLCCSGRASLKGQQGRSIPCCRRRCAAGSATAPGQKPTAPVHGPAGREVQGFTAWRDAFAVSTRVSTTMNPSTFDIAVTGATHRAVRLRRHPRPSATGIAGARSAAGCSVAFAPVPGAVTVPGTAVLQFAQRSRPRLNRGRRFLSRTHDRRQSVPQSQSSRPTAGIYIL